MYGVSGKKEDVAFRRVIAVGEAVFCERTVCPHHCLLLPAQDKGEVVGGRPWCWLAIALEAAPQWIRHPLCSASLSGLCIRKGEKALFLK